MNKLKTKKDILKWWQDIGNIEKQNDYKNFWEKIDKESVKIIEFQKGSGQKQEHKIILMKQNWKYPLELFFYDLECYKIINF